jgi:hypothetical protein
MPNRQWLLPVASSSGSGGGGGGSTAWSSLTSAVSNLTLANGTNTTTFDQTSATPWLWANTTVATAVTTNASPLLELAANYWTGSASASDTWEVGSSLAAGSNASSTLITNHVGSTGNAAQSVRQNGVEYLHTLIRTNGSVPGVVLSAPATNEQFTVTGNVTTLTNTTPCVVIKMNAANTATSGTQVGVALGEPVDPMTFSAASGNANFTAAGVWSNVAASASSGNVYGFVVNALGNSSTSSPFLTADFRNDNGSVFQVGPTGAIFPTGGDFNGSLTDNNASAGAANAVLTAGTGGGGVVWRVGTSAGPFTGAQITALTTVGGLVTAYTGSSDERLKTDIKPFERGIEAIEKLNPKFYKWNEEGQKKTGFKPEDEHVGLVAQNLQEAIPEAVGLEDGVWLTVNDRPVISTLINAVKQLSARVKELEARLS